MMEAYASTATTIDLGAKMRPGQQNDPRILVDPEDAWLLEYKWNVVRFSRNRSLYVTRHIARPGSRTTCYLHRVIMEATERRVTVDHINGNGLDNRRCNLRLATVSQNKANTALYANNVSGFKGVSRYGRTGKWQACASIGGKQRSLGYFVDPIDAACAYDQAVLETYGEFALTNEALGLYPWQKDEAAD